VYVLGQNIYIGGIRVGLFDDDTTCLGRCKWVRIGNTIQSKVAKVVAEKCGRG
jgi:hypothetical protein